MLFDAGVTLEGDQGGTVTVTAYPAALDLCDRPHPDSLYAAKFSLQHCVAAALEDGVVDFTSFETDARQRLHGVRGKIKVESGAPFTENYPRNWGCRVSVVAPDGREFTCETKDAKGDPEVPLSTGEFRSKAISLMRYSNAPTPARIVDEVLAMAEGKEAPDVMGLISGS
jgi:2-methylcitrate dehydratase PrpD